MGLYARFTSMGSDKITVHRFHAAYVEHLRGKLTAQQIVTAFNLTGDEQTEAQALVNAVNAAPDLAAKLTYVEAVHAVFLLVETGDYNEAQAKASLGF